MNIDSEYEVALSTARSMLRKLDEMDGRPLHERLATLTYLILDAIRDAQRLQTGSASRCICQGGFRSRGLPV